MIDSEIYDTEMINFDAQNGNFDLENFTLEDLEPYKKENLIQNSFVNGQFIQAKNYCEEYGFDYEMELYKFKNE